MQKCSKCTQEAVIRQGHQWLCAKHYRLAQMRARAKRDGKEVPSHETMEQLVQSDMACPDCGRTMNWRSIDGRDTVASLQHYRDGTIAIVCLSCNTRHAKAPGDSYRDMPKDHKFCPACKQFKPDSAFSSDNSRSGVRRMKSYCKECSAVSLAEWRVKNRDKYNEYQRSWRRGKKFADAMLKERAK